MDPRVSQSAIAQVPHAFVTKRGDPILITALGDARADALMAMYLAYEPRNAFWGLPPIRDDACRRWVRGMVAKGLNLVALSIDVVLRPKRMATRRARSSKSSTPNRISPLQTTISMSHST